MRSETSSLPAVSSVPFPLLCYPARGFNQQPSWYWSASLTSRISVPSPIPDLNFGSVPKSSFLLLPAESLRSICHSVAENIVLHLTFSSPVGQAVTRPELDTGTDRGAEAQLPLARYTGTQCSNRSATISSRQRWCYVFRDVGVYYAKKPWPCWWF